MKKLILATLACLMAVFMYAQKSDGIVYWSYGAGYQFDFDLDGKIDLRFLRRLKICRYPKSLYMMPMATVILIYAR